ncbi:MAG: hypothetical protein JWM92_271 [Candidatus Nomurabacteria bacterium]|nr:hypothetical protein [Candidatus Nomurabacteria bacterium]
MKRALIAAIIIMYSFSTAVLAKDLTSTDFIVRDPVIGTGGGYQSSGSFKMYSAGNLNISGDNGSSASYKGRDGFLQFPEVIPGTLGASTSGSTIIATWTASTATGGFNISGYNIGIATASGGPYTYTFASTALTYSYFNQTPGDYYLIVQTLDAFGNVIAVSNEMHVTVQETITFSISDNVLSFGPLTISGPRYATTTGGSSSVTPAHTISASTNASNGYTINYIGGTLTSGAATISPATVSGSSTGTAGTNQFALSLLSTGIASVPTTYDQTSQNWNFAANTLATIASTSGPSAVATLNAYYLANAATLDPAGTYSTTLTYEITANY